jgi:hypothetical protein
LPPLLLLLLLLRDRTTIGKSSALRAGHQNQLAPIRRWLAL